ncbi:MAG: DMT family transporter [Rhodospirillales bacterium]|nr:DMT family transporter [Rhodospirillales bacterium]
MSIADPPSDFQPARHRLPQPLRAMLWYVLALSLWGMSAGLVRYAALEVPAIELGFLRAFYGMVLVIPWLLYYRVSPVPRRHVGIYVLRGVCEVGGIATWFIALSLMQAADVVALGFTMPFFASILAAIFLGERLRLRRGLAILIGLIGAVIVIRPGQSDIGSAALIPLLGAIVVAVSRLSSRVLAARGEPMIQLVASLGFITAPILAIPAAFVWVWPSPAMMLLAFTVSVISLTGHVCMVRALRLGEASVLATYEFTQLLATVAIAAAVLGEWPDRWTWIGSAIILAAGLYIARREAALARKEASEKAGQ